MYRGSVRCTGVVYGVQGVVNGYTVQGVVPVKINLHDPLPTCHDIDRHLHDPVGSPLRDLLNVDPAVGARHYHRTVVLPKTKIYFCLLIAHFISK